MRMFLLFLPVTIATGMPDNLGNTSDVAPPLPVVQVRRQALRKPTGQIPTCRLSVVAHGAGVFTELHKAATYIQTIIRNPQVRLEAAPDGEAEMEEVDIGMTWVQLQIHRQWRRLHTDEIKMLRKFAGRWERWLALLEIHCLYQLKPENIASAIIFPQVVKEATEEILGGHIPSFGCVEVPGSDLPGVAEWVPSKHSVPLTGERGGGLGNCPGLLFVPTGPRLYDQRRRLRESWLSDFPGIVRPLGQARRDEPTEVDNCVDFFFITGWSSDEAVRARLKEEMDQHADLIIDCSMQDGVPLYSGLQHKFFKSIAVQKMFFPHAEYVVRASDDTYLHVPRLMYMVNESSPHRLFMGRAVANQTYRDEWPLHFEYTQTFAHNRLPGLIVGDVMVVSADIASWLLRLQEQSRHLAHFDDTVGVWLATTDGVRRNGVLRPDFEWIEWLEVMRGYVACPVGTLVVAHSPTWKDWQNQYRESVSNSTASKEISSGEDQEIIIEFMLKAISKAVRSTGDPCVLDAENYYETYKTMIANLVKMNWEHGRRMKGADVMAVSGRPIKPFEGANIGVPHDGLRLS